MSKAEGDAAEKDQLVRLSVVLSESLSEHVRRRAYETRKSRSAYVRDLVARDASGAKQGGRA